MRNADNYCRLNAISANHSLQKSCKQLLHSLKVPIQTLKSTYLVARRSLKKMVIKKKKTTCISIYNKQLGKKTKEKKIAIASKIKVYSIKSNKIC